VRQLNLVMGKMHINDERAVSCRMTNLSLCGVQRPPSIEPLMRSDSSATTSAIATASTMRSVGHAQARNADALDSVRCPHVHAGRQRSLFVKGEFGHEPADLLACDR
jgi:hypothetical protein